MMDQFQQWQAFRPPSSLLTKEPFFLRYATGPQLTRGVRLNELAAHYGEGSWRLSHLPSGLALASGFKTLDAAVSAMQEIYKLTNAWSDSNPRTFVPLVRSVAAIVQRHGGIIPVNRKAAPPAPALNGYRRH